jgi:hypothetical protein
MMDLDESSSDTDTYRYASLSEKGSDIDEALIPKYNIIIQPISCDKINMMDLDQIIDEYIQYEYFRNYFDNSFYKLYLHVEFHKLRDSLVKRYLVKLTGDQDNVHHMLRDYLNSISSGIELVIASYNLFGTTLFTRDFLNHVFMIGQDLNMMMPRLLPKNEELVIDVLKIMEADGNIRIAYTSSIYHSMIIYATEHRCFNLMYYLLDCGAIFMTPDTRQLYSNDLTKSKTMPKGRNIFGPTDYKIKKLDRLKDIYKVKYGQLVYDHYVEVYDTLKLYYANDPNMLSVLKDFE